MRALALVAAVLTAGFVFWLVGADDAPRRGAAPVSVTPREEAAENVAQPAVDVVPADDPAGLRSSGLVVDEARVPVAGARVVVISAKPPFAVHADGDGRFRLPAMRPASVQLDVTAPGFAYSRASIDLRNAATTVVYLQRGATLAGVVRTANGDAVGGATLRVVSNWRDYVARADAAGRYRIEKLAPGFLRAFVLSRAGHADQDARRPLTPLRAGETLTFDPIWRAGVTVSGTAAPGATVTLGILDSNRRAGSFPCDAGGRFACKGVLPGRYLLHPYGKKISSFGHGHEAPEKVIVYVGTADINGVRLALPGYGTVRVKTEPGPRSVRVMSRSVNFYGKISADGVATVRVPASSRVFAWVGKSRVGPFALTAGETVEHEIAAPEPDVIRTGIVLTPDGEPLRAASVTIAKTTAYTDATGRFTIALDPQVAATKRLAVAFHPQHAPGVASDDAAEIRIRMARARPVAGTVVDEAGNPCAFARVRLSGYSGWEGFGQPRASLEERLKHDWPLAPSSVNADAVGRFRFVHGAGGGFYLQAWHDGRETSSDWLKPDAAPFRLVVAGAAATGSIAGIVVDESGDIVRRAYVNAGERGDSTDLHGLFEINGLPPGRHDVEVGQRPGFEERGFATQFIRDVPVGTDDLVIRVAAGPTLRGLVLDEHGKPVPHAEAVFLKAEPTAYTLATRTDRNGVFELRGLTGAPFDLAIFARGFMAQVHRTRPGKETFRLQRGASITGRLLDASGDPASEYWVRIQMTKAVDPAQLAPWTRRKQSYLPYFGAKTDSAGRFRITGLLPGEYWLREPSRVPASTMVAGQRDVNLRFRALRTIEGTVVDEDGAPVQGRKISAHFHGRQVGYAPIGADGRFRVENVPDGDVSLHIVGNRELKTTRVKVGPGPVTGLRIVMQRE